ncbi:transcription factor bHLH118 [Malania oleifera]|uniref:transcription factor bHLH118 n=1 Tax=Malania oleifera TaxID=397392 RepID=UPI0025AD9D26|nr:transcription factor bHLH118 [Malania oleifera]
MDYVSPVFPLDRTDEVFSISFIPSQQQTVQKDELPSTSLDGNGCGKKPDYRRGRKPYASFGSNDDNPHESKKKKMMHRDIERQRRQEMAALYESLRSLLPQEYLQGKRSISDHMHEAVNYIRHLQKNLRSLSDRKDGLKRLSESSNVNVAEECSQKGSLGSAAVTVKPCWAGVEIVLSTALGEGGLPLSTVLGVLIGEGLSVVSCISAIVNERLIHTIESEVSDGRTVDLSGLQQKLADLKV